MAEEAFTFSRFPALAGPSLLAAVLAVSAVVAGRVAVSDNAPGSGLLIAISGAVFCRLAGRWMLTDGIRRFKLMRSQSRNLVATRGAQPRVWLVAHIDSKSQTIPMLVRVAAVVLSAIFYGLLIVALAAAFAAAMGWVPFSAGGLSAAALIASMLAALSLMPLIFCFIGNRSSGAVDNASGVAAVLIAARQLEGDAGVVITSGEELGLAGARAFVSSRGGRATALNCDTIDDAGSFLVMTSGASGSLRSSKALMAAGSGRGARMSARRLIPGILADHVAFSAAGWDSCTLSKGNLATLARVHTSGDRTTSIDGTGIALAAEILIAAVEELS